MSALGSSCACPTAFITFCPSWRLQRIQFHRHVQPAPSLNGWGCDLQGSTGLGVHPGQWSLLRQVLLLAGTRLPPPKELWAMSRVWCWLRRSQHNRQHMQFTRRKKSLSRAEKTALGAFRKRLKKNRHSESAPPPPRFRLAVDP